MENHYKVLQGRNMDTLPTLADKSVHCCVTSPPYFGLRDYGHEGQIGLEETPEQYVANLVAVFREVKRVLRDDGTVFLNLGDSYYGSSMTGGTPKRKNQMFSHEKRAQSYDIGGKAAQDYLGRDSFSENLCGEHKDAWWTSTEHTDTRLALEQVALSCLQIREHTGLLSAHLPNEDFLNRKPTMQFLAATLDSAHFAIRASEQLLSVLATMPVESFPQPPAGFRLLDMISAYRSSLHSFAFCVRQCVGMSDEQQETIHYTEDTASLFEELAHRIQCTDGYCLLVASWFKDTNIKPQCDTEKADKLKPKDLIGIPWRVAFALQADGWYLRQDIIWHKPNPMPESVTDRCTKAHEYIFLLTKSAKYWYDNEAIKENTTGGNKFSGSPAYAPDDRNDAGRSDKTQIFARNRRSVWTVATAPYKGAHFAVFPPDLIRPCVQAGCPAKTCPTCGKGWERVVENRRILTQKTNTQNKDFERAGGKPYGQRSYIQSTTTGFNPSCTCPPADPIAGIVVDPFAGSGTTGQVAIEEGRKTILCELNADYCKLIERRLAGVQFPLMF